MVEGRLLRFLVAFESVLGRVAVVVVAVAVVVGLLVEVARLSAVGEVEMTLLVELTEAVKGFDVVVEVGKLGHSAMSSVVHRVYVFPHVFMHVLVHIFMYVFVFLTTGVVAIVTTFIVAILHVITFVFGLLSGCSGSGGSGGCCVVELLFRLFPLLPVSFVAGLLNAGKSQQHRLHFMLPFLVLFLPAPVD